MSHERIHPSYPVNNEGTQLLPGTCCKVTGGTHTHQQQHATHRAHAASKRSWVWHTDMYWQVTVNDAGKNAVAGYGACLTHSFTSLFVEQHRLQSMGSPIIQMKGVRKRNYNGCNKAFEAWPTFSFGLQSSGSMPGCCGHCGRCQ